MSKTSITKILYICFMKLLCALLAFLVLTLTAQPPCIAANKALDCCSDNHCEDNLKESEHESKKAPTERCTKGCNPFQTCGCCAFSVLIPATISITTCFNLPHNPINWGVKIMYINEEPSSSFWQPPRYI